MKDGDELQDEIEVLSKRLDHLTECSTILAQLELNDHQRLDELQLMVLDLTDHLSSSLKLKGRGKMRKHVRQLAILHSQRTAMADQMLAKLDDIKADIKTLTGEDDERESGTDHD